MTAKYIPDALRDLPLLGEQLAADPALFKAFNGALGDPTLRELALREPAELLAKFGVRVPPGLSVTFFEGHESSRPYPFGDDWFPTIVLTNCRSIWVRTCKPSKKGDRPACSFQKEEFCFGFEILPGKWVSPIGGLSG